jgi:hypothetical protein
VREIDGKAKTIRDVLKDQRYAVDYYQREYRWQRKQVEELITDLTDQFNDDYGASHPRSKVQDYGHYFLGSIILSQREGKTFIVDGQQRLTTLTLLLICLHLLQKGKPNRVKLDDLIYSERYGARAFNISVPDRDVAMEALFKGEPVDTTDASESVQTIVDRYQDLEELLADGITEQAIPYFSDWLIDNVHLVEIKASTDEDAYTIFETMNDRGLSLTPLDMLKGYLLANITDAHKRTEAAKVWSKRMEALKKLGKDEDSDAIKAWLRARYAQSVRERHQGAENRDFERIGTEFHRWVKDHEQELGLLGPEDFFQFVHQKMAFYTRQYERLRQASLEPKQSLEPIYHVACWRFTLQYPLLLAAITPQDGEELIDQKFRIVATFLDILLARRAVNYLSMNFAALSYAIFNVIKEVRGLSPDAMAGLLHKKLDEQGCDFNGTKDGTRAGFPAFGLNHWSKGYIKTILARMTVFLEQGSHMDGSLPKFFATGKGRFEIEHIWADHPELHTDEFASPADFAEVRNLIGGLLLLPKKFNASYGDLPYAEKVAQYFGQNLLARSLNPQTYQHHPGFIQFIQALGLPFQPHPEFKPSDLQQRHQLYQKIAEQIWDPELLHEEV